ncbi:MAG: T9SS type A sorting domain-containing protein, partial [bacterium]|nr:T9SS type A sorting domain-containing protein [bacterium]
ARGRVSGEKPDPWEPLHPELIGGLEGSYLDREPPSGRVRYLVEAETADGGRVRFDPIEVYVGEGEGALPRKIESSLDLPWPSPADDRIDFDVVISRPDAGRPVTVNVYDLAGRRVIVVFTGELTEGSHRVTADTARLAPGVYVLRLDTATAALNRRFAVVR